MKALIQRVKWAKVSVEGQEVGSVSQGLMTLLGIAPTDNEIILEKLVSKILKLRIFEDDAHKMNLSLEEIKGEHLIISQFTLFGDTSSGNRPGFSAAARPEIAKPLYEKSLKISESRGIKTAGGIFGADMQVTLLNDGPVTLMLEQN